MLAVCCVNGVGVNGFLYYRFYMSTIFDVHGCICHRCVSVKVFSVNGFLF